MTPGIGVFGLVLALDLSLIVATATLLLGGRQWARAAPRLAIALWQACGLSLLLALVAVITVSLLPADEAGTNLSVASCLALLVHRLSAAHLLTPTVLLAVAAAAALVRVLLVVARRARSGSMVRRQQRESLDLLRPAETGGAHVLDAARPLAYAVPGGGGRVVVTTGALELLADDEVAAVVAHERAHLRGRHHLVLLAARAARDLLPTSRWARRAQRDVAELLELAADDHAARSAGGAPVARAVATLSGDAARPAVAARVRRLAGGPAPLPALTRVAVAALAAVLVSLPASVVVAPVALAHGAHPQP